MGTWGIGAVIPKYLSQRLAKVRGTFAPTDILRICPRDYSPRDYFRPQKLHVVIYVKVCGLFLKISAKFQLFYR